MRDIQQFFHSHPHLPSSEADNSLLPADILLHLDHSHPRSPKPDVHLQNRNACPVEQL